MPLPIPSRDQIFNQLNTGRIWPSLSITFSFPTSPSQFSVSREEAPGFTPLLAAGQEAVRLALSLWDDLIVSDFREVSTNGGTVRSDLEFGLSLSGVDFAHAYYPTAGSVWFNASYGASAGTNNLINPTLGRHGFLTYVHEIGHALGLDHAGNYNGTGDWQPLNFHDSTVFSVMSYFGPNWSKGQGSVEWADWVGADNVLYSPQTPMLNDVYVIQRMYGAEVTTRLGDTVYGFNSNITDNLGLVFDFSKNKNPIITIYDSGGTDTLDLSGWSTSSIIDLRQGRFSSCNSMTNNVAISYGCDIENARGGAGSDKIFGNSLDNILNGGGGDDWFNGLEGNDKIYGGSGNDTVYFSLESNLYQITSYQSYITVQRSGITTVIYESEYIEFSDRKILISSLTSSSDVTAPTILSFSPADGASSVAVGSNIALNFSENIARGSGSITLRSGSPTGSIIESFDAATSSRISISGATLTIDPTNTLANSTNYFLVLETGSIKDLFGNSHVGVNSYDFQTSSSDVTAPTILSFSPADGASSVAVGSNIALNFSENIARGSGSITLRSGSPTGSIIESFDAATSSRISISGATLTIDPTSSLPSGTQVFATFAAGSIKDLAGNAYSGTSSYDFTTAGTLTTDDFTNATDTTGVVAIDGKATEGKIETAGDADAFKVTLTAGATYIFSLTTTSGSLDPYLEIYNADTVLVASNDDYGSSQNSRITFTPTTGGTYYLSASDFSDTATGTYKLQAIKSDVTAPTVLTFLPADGSTAIALESSVIVSFSEDIARGSGTITLRSGSPTGSVIESFDVATSSRLLIIGSRLTIDPTSTLPSGTKVFVTFTAGSIKDLAGNAYSGTSSYDFTTAGPVIPDDFPSATDTTGVVAIDGKATEGKIETAGDADAFKVTLTAGTTYSFSLMRTSGSLDSYLEIYNTDLVQVASNDDYSSDTYDSGITFTATYSGTYYLRASDYHGTATGNYSLTARVGTPIVDDFPNSSETLGIVTLDGKATEGKIETAGDADAFKVTLTAGTTYNFSLTRTSGSLDPYLVVYNSDLLQVASNDDYSSDTYDSGITFTATYSGTYYLQTSDYDDAATGSYRLTARVGTPIVDDFPNSSGTLGIVTLDGKATEGKIETAGDADAFKVTLTAGTTYNFSLTRTSGSLDPYLVVYNADLVEVAYNDDYSAGSYDSGITFTATYSGTYYLQASDYDDAATGSYNLTASLSSQNRSPTFSAASQSVSTNEDTAKAITLAATDADNDQLTYTAAAAANGTVSVSGAVATYTPKLNYSGTDSFVVTASDGKGGTATQTVSVAVAAVNDVPTFSASSQSVAATAGTAKTITLAASDVDGDALTYSVATPGKGTATISGSTLTYTPAASATGSDSFVVTASDGKGGTAAQTINATIAASSTGASSAVDFRMSTSDGWTGTVGGNGQIFGSSGFQDIKVSSGTLTLDASFNRGGDIIRLPDAASSYTIARSGSSAQISNAGLTAIIPVGTTGLATIFADGVRKLIFADGSLKIGSQAFSASASITAGTDNSTVPTGTDSAATARISLSGNDLAAAQTAHVTIGGTATLFGTSSNDVVALAAGAKSSLTFDASFNRGGDTIILGKDAGSFSAVRSGSSIVLTATDQTLTIPVGTAGLTLRFTDGNRSLAFTGGVFKIGDQTIEQTSTALTSATVTISLDVGTDASRAALSGSNGAVVFTDNAAAAGNVRITGFGADDVIRVTGSTESKYSFTSGDLDSDGSADDLSMVFNAGSGVVNIIEILNVVSPSDFIFDKASALKAVGFNFVSFG